MSIKTIRLRNCTVFQDLTMKLSKGVNVVIGKNGTGKTHLLKAIYGACEASKEKDTLALKFIKCFKENAAFIDIFNDKSDLNADIYLNLDKYKGNEALHTNTISVNRENKIAWGGYAIHLPQNVKMEAIYIPVKDMLTHAKGLLAMSEKYQEFPFDITLTDIIRKANQWTVKESPVIAKTILPILENIIDGEVVTDNDEFFIKKRDGSKVSFALESEGRKKIGLLWRLLMNESISENSILLWDEPEANLNPEYLPILVECLLALSRKNVQVIVSTHNYIFAKYFDVRRKKSDKLKFHALYSDLWNKTVTCETKKSFSKLKHNEITYIFDRLLDEVYDLDEGE